MKHYILLALSICLFTTVNAQKTKVAPAKTDTKSFIVSAATANDLPDGVTYTNNKITLKAGYKFETVQSNGDIKLVNAKGVTTGTFRCGCSFNSTTKGPCSFSTAGQVLTCTGSTCCVMQTTIDPPKISDMQMKQN